MMSGDRQSQKAGDNSQLMQAGTINVYNNGIDEKRAREICLETYEVVRRDFTKDAYACASERVQKFENSLLSKIQQIEGALNAFADPSFQFLLTRAQKTAAATEREADYDMLSELLICRITKGDARKHRAEISRAVEVIDMIDNDALCALTVVHCVNELVPTLGSCKAGLEVLANIFEKLIYMELPTGTDWIEHLDILDTVRIKSIVSMKKLDEYYLERLSGYSVAGICIDSESYRKAIKQLENVGLNSSILVQNELLEGYVRLPVVTKSAIKEIILSHTTIADGKLSTVTIPINDKQISALEEIWDMYSTDANVKQLANTAFMSIWDSYPSLKRLHDWWDSLRMAFSITHIGRVLAHTNARRCDKSIPELPL